MPTPEMVVHTMWVGIIGILAVGVRVLVVPEYRDEGGMVRGMLAAVPVAILGAALGGWYTRDIVWERVGAALGGFFGIDLTLALDAAGRRARRAGGELVDRWLKRRR